MIRLRAKLRRDKYNIAMTAQEIIEKYIKFFEDRGHNRITNSPLVPVNDPTTLFTSSGMQPLVPYLLGQTHPQGNRLVDVQNCFRAVDIDEVGDNRHTTFFRMLGNWSLGDYFKSEEIPWLWEFLTSELRLPKEKLYITVFKGDSNVPFDQDAKTIWKGIFEKENIEPKIFADATNWWSRSGPPEKMPAGEPGGPDTEVYFRFDDVEHKPECGGDDPTKCECGKFLEIANSVFMQYQKMEDGSLKELTNKNVDFGGGLERLLAAVENKSDIFQTSLFAPIIEAIVKETGWPYERHEKIMRIVADHFSAATLLISAGIKPSKTEQGYILRRLIRRGFDSFRLAHGTNISSVLEAIIEQYGATDPYLKEKYEEIKNTILEEEQNYKQTIGKAEKIISLNDTGSSGSSASANPSKQNNDPIQISPEEAFKMYTTHGLSPTQIKSLGYVFDDQEFANKMEEHANISRAGATKKFAGGLADHSEATIMGHTATHLLHQAVRDLLGDGVHQSGSNITAERVRFDFNFDRNLTPEEIQTLEQTVNKKIEENLPVFFEFMPLEKAKEIGAIGLFDEKYSDKVKIYLIGSQNPDIAYSKEFCGGPHVDFTGKLKSFKIIKQENIGREMCRIYAKVG